MFWITDPKSGHKSVTLTLMVIGFIVALLKLLLAGNEIHGIHFAAFTGVDFSAVVAALGSIYAFRKHSDKAVKKDE